MTSLFSRRFAVVIVAILIGTLSRAASAATLYASSYEGQSLWSVDTVAQTASPVWFTTGYANPDSLMFDSTGRIIYTDHLNGYMRRVDLSASTDTILATPSDGLYHPTDMVFDPSGNSILVSDYWDPYLRRVSLSGGATILASGSVHSGLVYLGSKLYANAGGAPVSNGDECRILDPVTGATLATTGSIPGASLDGLCYDSYTGHLWASSLTSSQLFEIDPSTLTYTAHAISSPAGFGVSPDGICTDGSGKIWFASRSDFTVYEYDINTQLDTPIVAIYGLDDLAPASGPGSIMPEPGSMALITPLMALLTRRKTRAGLQ